MAERGAPIGNQNASKKQRFISDALRRKLVQDPERAARIAEKVLQEAEAGNLVAFKELMDRTEGKVPQAIVGDDDEAPITIKEILIRAVDATSDRPTEEG